MTGAELQTERLRLVPLTAAHEEAYAAVVGARAARAVVSASDRHWREDGLGCWALCDDAGFAGAVELRPTATASELEIGPITAHGSSGQRVGEVHPNLPGLADREFAETDAGALADGVYHVVVAPQGLAAATETLTVDRTLTGLTASSQGVSPNGDGVDDTVAFSFTLSQPVSVELTIDQNGAPVATPFDGALPAGSSSIAWDGTGTDGTRLPEGSYVAMLTYSAALGTFTQSLPVTVDVTPPTLSVVDPAKLVFSPDSRPRRIRSDSSMRPTRAPAASNGIPAASYSSRSQPAPRPSSKRPPDRWSSVAASFASITGCR